MAVERVDGVRSAAFHHPEGTGRVTYDTTLTSPPVFMEELARSTGFEAAVVPGG